MGACLPGCDFYGMSVLRHIRKGNSHLGLEPLWISGLAMFDAQSRAWAALWERFHGMHGFSQARHRKDGATSILSSERVRGGNLPASYSGLAIAVLDGLVALFGATLGSRFSMVQATLCHGGAPKALCVPT